MNENKEDMKMDIIITETVIREFEKHLRPNFFSEF